MKYGCAQASPSLALIKYWGKASAQENLPATSSIALTLDGLKSITRVSFTTRDEIIVNGQVQHPGRYEDFLHNLRLELKFPNGLQVESTNNFPTAAGLASSSSGFAALAGAAAALCGAEISDAKMSALARLGSGSATRSVFGGFTHFPAGAREAHQIHSETFWPDIRVVVVTVRDEAKGLSSRKAMEYSRTTSPYYQAWIDSSREMEPVALEALGERNLDTLGPMMRQSYLRMFGTMFSSDPPVIYWYPESLALIKFCQGLRDDGLGAWETMDAGPQVKIFCLAKDLEGITDKLSLAFPGLRILTAGPGPGLRTWTEEK